MPSGYYCDWLKEVKKEADDAKETYGIIRVLNEIRWLPTAVENFRRIVDKLFVVDGRMVNYPGKNPYSTDGSMEWMMEAQDRYENVKYVLPPIKYKDKNDNNVPFRNQQDKFNYVMDELIPDHRWTLWMDPDEVQFGKIDHLKERLKKTTGVVVNQLEYAGFFPTRSDINGRARALINIKEIKWTLNHWWRTDFDYPRFNAFMHKPWNQGGILSQICILHQGAIYTEANKMKLKIEYHGKDLKGTWAKDEMRGNMPAFLSKSWYDDQIRGLAPLLKEEGVEAFMRRSEFLAQVGKTIPMHRDEHDKKHAGMLARLGKALRSGELVVDERGRVSNAPQGSTEESTESENAFEYYRKRDNRTIEEFDNREEDEEEEEEK